MKFGDFGPLTWPQRSPDGLGPSNWIILALSRREQHARPYREALAQLGTNLQRGRINPPPLFAVEDGEIASGGEG